MTYATRVSVTVTTLVLVGALTAWTTAGSVAAEPAPSVVIEPNAIQNASGSMKINVRGRAGATVHLFILKSCDSDPNTPEITPTKTCNPRVVEQPFTLDSRGQKTLELKMSRIPRRLHGHKLWARVAIDTSGRGAHGQAVFTVLGDSCSVLETIWGLVADNDCTINMDETLKHQRGGSAERPDIVLEVRRLARNAAGKWTAPQIVPGTRGATGVAWADEDSLYVTIGRIAEDLFAPANAPPPAKPGLYRIDRTSGQRTLLLASEDDETFAAPFAVRPGCMVFVRERVIAAPDGTVATLAVWRHGRGVTREIPLRQSIHQILAAEPKRPQVLAYSRWRGVPALLSIDLRSQVITHLGAPEYLFHAALRAPGRGEAVMALEDNAGDNGWDLILVNEKGALSEEVLVGAGDDLMAAWRPGGMEIVYLGQAERD